MLFRKDGISYQIARLTGDSDVQWVNRAKDMALLIIAIGGVLTLSTGAWSEHGWVSKSQYKTDVASFVTRAEFDTRSTATATQFTAQTSTNREVSASLNEIKALIAVVPQLKALIRNRCGGGRGLNDTIEGLKRQYRELTGTEYREPSCGSPELE